MQSVMYVYRFAWIEYDTYYRGMEREMLEVEPALKFRRDVFSERQ